MKSEMELLQYNLQFFAKMGPGGEKTEEPTSKKLEDSRKEGQVAKSQELTQAFSLIGVFILLRVITENLGKRFIENFYYIYSQIPDFMGMKNGDILTRDIVTFLRIIILRILLLIAPFFAVGFVVAFVTNLVQVKWKPTTKPLKPKFSKLNPVNGVKRLFSKDKLVELLKSIIKVSVIFYVAYSMLKNQIGIVFALYDMTLNAALVQVGTLVMDVGLRISLVYLIVGFADYAYQKWKFHEDMKMTKQEVKDEMKNSEGDPQVKGQQKQRMREASRRRMMSKVPEADVVITNPTHFAVALKYDTMIADAPMVIAKGEDYMAQKIKEKARETGVEIVENRELARLLYHNVPLDGLVPPQLYQAVAEVLAFVYNLKNNKN